MLGIAARVCWFECRPRWARAPAVGLAFFGYACVVLELARQETVEPLDVIASDDGALSALADGDPVAVGYR